MIGLVIVVVFAGFMIWSKISSEPITQVDNTQGVDNTLVPLKVDTEDTSTGSVNAGISTPSISYANALIKYKDARIQLNAACQATPNNMTFKNGTSIMIDNRASVALTVKAGSVFTIKAYGFKIVKLSSATLPATWLVDCGTSQNVATLLIQK